MQQRLESEDLETSGYTPEEYREVVRRAQKIRAEQEGRLSHEQLAESAAEVGIREEDLREAARQLREEQRQQALEQQERVERRKKQGLISAAVAGLLGLSMLFTYNGLNAEYHDVRQARANLQSTLQRRADVVPQIARVVREGAAQEKALVDRLAQTQEKLQSADVAAQMEASRELAEIGSQVGSNPQLRGSSLYEDLTAGLEGSENRINVARNRYNEQAAEYNEAVSGFPGSLVRPLTGLPAEMPLFEASAEASAPPRL